MTAETLPRKNAPSTTPAALGLGDRPAKAGPGDPAATHVRVKLDVEIRALLAHEPGTKSGADPEDLHQMRVALRRMRSVLKLSGRLVGPDAEAVRAELGWLGQSLGEVRDYDVLIGHLREVVAEFEVRDQPAARRLVSKFVTERGVAKRRLTRALASPRYASLLQDLGRLARQPATEEADERPQTSADLAKPHRKLAKAVKTLPADPPDDDLHALRIYGKKLRYAAEMAKPAAKKKQAERIQRLIKATKNFQTVLGDHQDACVAADRMRGVVASVDSEVAFIAGRIAEKELLRRAEVRAAWRDVWAEVDEAAQAVSPRI
ncbi:CHAD domain-containing protein [Amycolatopsis lurida]|uniref:Metal-chelation protein CHAD n=1 Tax=Amycolatopsis lurida NRRL 2430 TaxID=1460371 RepID=A0A2P2G2Z2_AMYLU|nr:CHAD domain-containing protein [Amycolatopsis lurida]KFU83336.1 metal-chelation protein CHAD [Amycolatopsis lurida NRRL 2430]SED24938.1 CHAD domain-containing protein [Amycolatopsis lurida]